MMKLQEITYESLMENRNQETDEWVMLEKCIDRDGQEGVWYHVWSEEHIAYQGDNLEKAIELYKEKEQLIQ